MKQILLFVCHTDIVCQHQQTNQFYNWCSICCNSSSAKCTWQQIKTKHTNIIQSRGGKCVHQCPSRFLWQKAWCDTYSLHCCNYTALFGDIITHSLRWESISLLENIARKRVGEIVVLFYCTYKSEALNITGEGVQHKLPWWSSHV